MIDQTIKSKIKKIKIQTKRIMQSTLSGDYLSAFKGSGLEFHQIREYIIGDDVRSIDWNSSAKMNKVMIKQFVEERERTVILAIDVSASTLFSSNHELKKESIASLAATLAFIATANKDNVGALFFSDRIEQWIPPKKGNMHLGMIIETIFTMQPTGKKTSIATALRYLVGLKKKNAVVFMISDWIDDISSYTRLLKVAGCEYDFVCMRMLDDCEKSFSDVGFIDLKDPETGRAITVDTRGIKKQHNPLAMFMTKRIIEQKKTFEKFRIDMLDISVGKPFVNQLVVFFHQRIARQV